MLTIKKSISSPKGNWVYEWTLPDYGCCGAHCFWHHKTVCSPVSTFSVRITTFFSVNFCFHCTCGIRYVLVCKGFHPKINSQKHPFQLLKNKHWSNILHFCACEQNETTEPHCIDKFEFSRRILTFLVVDVFNWSISSKNFRSVVCGSLPVNLRLRTVQQAKGSPVYILLSFFHLVRNLSTFSTQNVYSECVLQVPCSLATQSSLELCDLLVLGSLQGFDSFGIFSRYHLEAQHQVLQINRFCSIVQF